MSEPSAIAATLVRVIDAFNHASGPPTFEPGIDPETSEGIIRLQKACGLLTASRLVMEAQLYGAVVEQSFIAIEHSFSSYLIERANIDEAALTDHDAPYDAGRKHLPLESATVDAIKQLYHARRTDHYYNSTVSTREQAEGMSELATCIHTTIAHSDPVLRSKCTCDGPS